MKDCPPLLATRPTPRDYIIAADLAESNVDIAKKAGVTPQQVSRVRRAAGILPQTEDRPKCAIEGCEWGASRLGSYCTTDHDKLLAKELQAARTPSDKGSSLKPRGPCAVEGCGFAKAKDGSYCTSRHYNLLVNERLEKNHPKIAKEKEVEPVRPNGILHHVPAPAVASPKASRASYDIVILDLQEKADAILATIETLKVMRGD